MKNEEFIKNKEYYLAKLSRIINFIKSCDKTLYNIYCGYCNNMYTFNNYSKHKCKYKLK
jgi:hypothetical protein